MFRIYVAFEGFDPNERWGFTFNTPRELARFLRKLGKRELKRVPISKIFDIVEGD